MSLKELPFVIERAESRKGPWVRAAGGRCFEFARQAYTVAIAAWSTGRENRVWFRVRHVNGNRAAHIFEGGTYREGYAGVWERISRRRGQ